MVFAVALFALIAVQGTVLYSRGNAAMQSQLRTQLRTSAGLAAGYFTGEDIDRIRRATDINSAHYRTLVDRLNSIRNEVPNIEYAYIMRKTDDPMLLEFVADADSLDSFEETDLNGNGIIEPDEENSYPGDIYDITDIDIMRDAAFNGPVADEHITVDQWGELISGYAPIYRSDGTVAGIIGIDMNAKSFMMLAERAFSPLLLLLLLALGLLLAGFVGYFLWKRKVEMVTMLDKERSSLLALTSHQLGAPVVSIKWWLEILRENGHCDQGKACDTIENAVNRIAGIISALREAERTEHGTGSRSSRVHIADSVNLAAKNMADFVKIKRQNILVSCDCQSDVYIDPKLLEAVLTELIQNASTYSPAGSDIRITCARRGNKVALEISDQGCGVPAGEELRIFDKLTRGTNAGLWKTDGNGLGLYICKTSIERAGGRISVRKNQQNGSIFSVSLPVAQ